MCIRSQLSKFTVPSQLNIMMVKNPKRIVIFASGSGSNAENIITYFKSSLEIEVVAVLTNKKNAKVLERCDRLGINGYYFNKQAFMNANGVRLFLTSLTPDVIVLAGFLLKIPKQLVLAFPNKIINIHPALLPKYGGKGMYGNFVHQAVKANTEKKTGITIHYVNEAYDEGAIIFQATTELTDEDAVETIAKKVHELEYEHYPKVIEKLLLDDQ